MKIQGSLGLVVVLAACAGGNQFSTGAIGPVSQGVGCVAEEVQEAGWTVVSRNDAGMLRAERGGNWIDAEIIPGDNNTHAIRMQTSDTPEARDTVEDVLANCG